jgi:hypothetical protein
VVDDREHRIAGGHNGLLLAATPGQAPVARAQEGLKRQLAKTMRPSVPGSQGLPLSRPLALDFPADWWVCGQNLAHDTRFTLGYFLPLPLALLWAKSLAAPLFCAFLLPTEIGRPGSRASEADSTSAVSVGGDIDGRSASSP